MFAKNEKKKKKKKKKKTLLRQNLSDLHDACTVLYVTISFFLKQGKQEQAMNQLPRP